MRMDSRQVHAMAAPLSSSSRSCVGVASSESRKAQLLQHAGIHCVQGVVLADARILAVAIDLPDAFACFVLLQRHERLVDQAWHAQVAGNGPDVVLSSLCIVSLRALEKY